jgi:low affinity Fe/Cu permease
MSRDNSDNKPNKGWFTFLAQATANAAGSAPAFALAVLVVIVWACTGPMFHYSEVWQLVINTGTTIVTFLMVFLVQNAQNRDGKIIQLKLDELIRAVENANNAYVNMENMSEQELEDLRQEYIELAQKAARTRSTRAAGATRREAAAVADKTDRPRRRKAARATTGKA